jgi:hypothetical protein
VRILPARGRSIYKCRTRPAILKRGLSEAFRLSFRPIAGWLCRLPPGWGHTTSVPGSAAAAWARCISPTTLA